mmetsp:Transcript_3989/g.10303  ORF Transcript_3989/g.10303 Transcript_3989/m.10303 type:complete len:262 (+) Transcript_3989:103-888(+)
MFALRSLATAARPSLGRRGLVARQVAEYVPMSATAGIAGFQGSELSLWTAFAVVVLSLPGVISTITRTGQAKFVEKSYVMPGTAVGGLEMRSIAGGVVAYFRSRNYTMDSSKDTGKIRFTGQMEGSVSQALYLSSCLLGAWISIGFVLQSFIPEGPFGLGPNLLYLPALTSPAAGWYYWGRAFRRDVVELQLEMSDDKKQTSLFVLGDKETVEALQTGVRFQSPAGKMYQLMERGMEYQPGLFDADDVTIIKQKEPVKETA